MRKQKFIVLVLIIFFSCFFSILYLLNQKPLIQEDLNHFIEEMEEIEEVENETMVNCIGKYKLNSESGSIAIDDRGYANGTLVNMEDEDWVAGKLNNCLKFDASNEYVNLGNNFNFEFNVKFSLEGWIKTDGSSVVIFCKTDGGKGYTFDLYQAKLYFQLGEGAGKNNFEVFGSTLLNDGEWHHVVITYNGNFDQSGVKLYVDTQEEELTYETGTIAESILHNVVAKMGMPGATTLYIDEFRIYEGVLSIAQIQEIYNDGEGSEDVYTESSEYQYITVANLEAFSGKNYSLINEKYTDSIINAQITHAEQYINTKTQKTFTGTIPDGIKHATLLISRFFMNQLLMKNGYLVVNQKTWGDIMKLIDAIKIEDSIGIDSISINGADRTRSFSLL